jgi:hypothetical protein
MKNIFTLLIFAGLFFVSLGSYAQELEAQAEQQTREMAVLMKLNEGEYMRLKNFNLNRLHQIAALASLREQDNRYLDLRLDLIEEEYASTLYNTFRPKQYAAYKEYRRTMPDTYAGMVMQNNSLKITAIAIQQPEE